MEVYPVTRELYTSWSRGSGVGSVERRSGKLVTGSNMSEVSTDSRGLSQGGSSDES